LADSPKNDGHFRAATPVPIAGKAAEKGQKARFSRQHVVTICALAV